jgi:hypothetical protein
MNELKKLMRFVHNNKEIAKEKGKKARIDMISKYSPEIISQSIFKNLLRIYKFL